MVSRIIVAPIVTSKTPPKCISLFTQSGVSGFGSGGDCSDGNGDGSGGRESDSDDGGDLVAKSPNLVNWHFHHVPRKYVFTITQSTCLSTPLGEFSICQRSNQGLMSLKLHFFGKGS